MARRRLPKFLPIAEIAALIGSARNERDRLILLWGFRQGLRVSEICKLRIEDVDFPGGTVLIARAKGDKDRRLPLHPELAEKTTEFLAGRATGCVFESPRKPGCPLTSRSVQRMIRAAAARAGITRRCTPHSLRHSFATHLLRGGADIMEIKDLLGHASIATTMQYLSADPERLKGVIATLKLPESTNTGSDTDDRITTGEPNG